MSIESVGSPRPTVTPLGEDIKLGDIAPGGKKELSPEEAALLLQQLQQVDGGGHKATQGVPPPETGHRSDGVKGMEQAIGNAQTNLATDIYEFMALYSKIAQQMRATAREQRQSELTAQVSAINTAAEKMVEAAQERFTAAMVQGITQIVGGAISIGSGAFTLGKIASASKPKVDLPESSDMPTSRPRSNAMVNAERPTNLGQTGTKTAHTSDADFAPGSKFSLELQAKQSLFSGSGQLVTGSGGMIAAGFEREASMLDSEGKEQEALGTAAQARREGQQEIAQTMADLLRDIREQLRAMVQAEVESNKGIARNI